MHEATMAQSILKIVSEKLGRTRNVASATRVQVKAGEFRNVDEESLQFAFDNLKGEYAGAENCALEMEIVSARALCNDGQHEYHPEYDHAYRCKICGSGIGKLLCGEELDVVSISLEIVEQKETETHA